MISKSKKSEWTEASAFQLEKKSNPSWMWVVLALLGFGLYANTLCHGYVLDDLSQITNNHVIQEGIEGIPTIFKTHYRYGYWGNQGTLYRPFALSLFAIQWELWPNNPYPPHVINVLLYVLCGLLLFKLLLVWSGRGGPWLAFISSVLFLVHPIHTEVVANIKSADELLGMVFLLGALLSLWKTVEKGSIAGLLSGLLLYFFSLMTKESAITYLAVIPLALWFFSKRSVHKIALWSSLFLIPAALYLLLRASVLDVSLNEIATSRLDNILSPLEGTMWGGTALWLCGLYLWKLVWPATLSHDYSFNQLVPTDMSDPLVYVSLFLFLSLGFFALIKFKERNWLSFSVLIFLISFSLVSNLVITIGTHFAERLMFLPSIGFAMTIGGLVWRFGSGSWKLDSAVFYPKKAVLSVIILGVLVLAGSAKTIDRNKDWSEEYTLYLADVENAPNSTRTHFRLGLAILREKLPEAKTPQQKAKLIDEAKRSLTRSIEISPTYADALGELGLAFFREEDWESAEKFLNESLKYAPDNYTNLNNLGSVYFSMGHPDQALPYFEKAVELQPRYIDAIGNLASAHGQLQHFDDAIIWFHKAVKLRPNEGSYYYFLAITYQNKGDAANAKKYITIAQRSNSQYQLPK